MTVRMWLDASDNWATAADWSGGVVPGASDDVVVAKGAPQVTAPIAVHSINDRSQISFANAGGSSVAAGMAVSGLLLVDGAANSGGSSLSMSGTMTLTGQAQIGNASSSGFTTVSVGGLVNSGSLTLNAAASEATYLNVHGTAGFGTLGTLSGTVTLSGSSVIRFSSGSIRTIAARGSLTLNGAQAFVSDSGSTTSNSALTGLATIAAGGSIQLAGGASVATAASLVNAGTVGVDTGSGTGGSTFQVGTALTNAGTLQIGNAALSADATVQVQSLKNRGTIALAGSSTHEALLNITGGTAGFGVAGTITGTVKLSGNSLVEVAFGQFSTIAAGATLDLDGANAFIATAGRLASNSALTGLKVNDGHLTINGGASIAVSGSFRNSGFLSLGDSFFGSTGGALSVQSTLTNTGQIVISSDVQDGQTSIVAAAINNTGDLTVGDSFGVQVFENNQLVISGSAGFGTAGAVTGAVSLFNGGLIRFKSGEITTIKASATLQLGGGLLTTGNATTTNSALTQLARNDGQFYVQENETVATAVAFANSGAVIVTDGGSFSTASTLTNTGKLYLGFGETYEDTSTVTVERLRNSGLIKLAGYAFGSDSVQGLVVHAAAGTGTAGILTGEVDLSGSALLQFASGQIGTIEGKLSLDGSIAYVADQGSTASNSALVGLKEVSGTLAIDNGASLQLPGALDVSGELDVGPKAGGSSLTVATTLENEGDVTIGAAAIASAASVTAKTVVNDGRLALIGNDSAQALLTVSSAAGFGSAGTVTGEVDLTGNTTIQFTGGGFTSIQSDASLLLDGATASLAIAGNGNTNGALRGLRTVDGTLTLRDGTTVVANSGIGITGDLILDDTGGGGSILSSGGILDNEGRVSVGNVGMTSADDLAVTGLVNNGSLALTGAPAGLAELYVGSAAGFGTAGELTGDVSLTGTALLAFASGSIGTIDAGASLALSGANARIAVSGSSALTKLAEIGGTLVLDGGGAVQTSGTVVNDGTLKEDTSVTIYGDLTAAALSGGSLLSVGGRFDNEGRVTLGNASMAASDGASATSLLNNGTITLQGNGTAHAQLAVSGTTTNNGDIYFTSDVQTFAGAVTGSGEMFIYAGTTLEFDGSVAASQSIAYGGADELVLGAAKTFAGSIQGFVSSDTLDLKQFAAGSTLSYAGDTSSGILTVTNGTDVAHLNLQGSYTGASFARATDGAGGLLISHT